MIRKRGATTLAALLVMVTSCTPQPSTPPPPTETKFPTVAALPTSTPRPTTTPRPTATRTPVPQPIIRSGTGDDVVDIDKWEGAALLHISYQGGRNFVVWSYDAAGNQMQLLVNTIGQYEGTVPLDFRADEHTARLQIESSGPWSLQVLPLSEIRILQVPSTFEGAGDDVVAFAATPDLLRVDASRAESNFVIWAYGQYVDLLVNEIAPYTGVVVAGSDTAVIAVTADGEWSIEVTAR
jgi:hypothetical protein